MKRLVSIVLCLVMLAGLLPTVVFAKPDGIIPMPIYGELKDEITKIALLFQEEPADILETVGLWLADDKAATADMESWFAAADKATATSFACVDLLYMEYIINLLATREDSNTDAMRCILDHLVATKEPYINLLDATKDGSTDLIAECAAELKGKLEETYAVTWCDEEEPEGEALASALTDFRRSLKNKAANRFSSTRDRYLSYMEVLCNLMGADDRMTREMKAGVDVWLTDKDAETMTSLGKKLSAIITAAEEAGELEQFAAERADESSTWMAEILCSFMAEAESVLKNLPWDELKVYDVIKCLINEYAPTAYKLSDMFDAYKVEDYENTYVLLKEVCEDWENMFEKAIDPDGEDGEFVFPTEIETYYENLRCTMRREKAAADFKSGVVKWAIGAIALKTFCRPVAAVGRINAATVAAMTNMFLAVKILKTTCPIMLHIFH